MKIVFALLLFTLIFSGQYRAQSCTSCSFTISGSDTSAYTVNSGQSLCIDSTGQFNGTVTLNGGTICNQGVFAPASFTMSSGTINNYALLLLKTDMTVVSGLTLYNGPQSTASLLGNLTLSGGSISNDGISNIANTITFSSGSFSNSAIVNCQVLTGSNAGTITNTGVINQN